MASQGEPTRVRATAPPPAPAGTSGIELTTLFLSAVASAAAAYITSKIWAPGTLFSAAMSPVIVALVKEGLRRPTEKVVEVVPTALPVPSRWTRTGPGDAGLVPEQPRPVAEARDEQAPHVVLPPVVASDHGPVNVYSTRSRRLRWRVALITGLLGFAVCVVLFTVPELIAGQSLGRGSGDATTIFGGHSAKHKSTKNKTQTTGTTSTTGTSTTKTTATTPSKTTPAPQTETQPSTPTPAAPSTATPSSAAPASTATPGAAQP